MDHWLGLGWSDGLVGGIQISQWRERWITGWVWGGLTAWLVEYR